MWFKNLRIYRLNKPLELSANDLAEMLAAHPFSPCSGQEQKRFGFVPPLGRHGDEYLHAANDYWMVCGKKQEKVLPGAAIAERLEERVAELALEENRRIGRKERQKIKEDIIFELLPRALTRSQLQFGYLALQEQRLYVDAASSSRAEELLEAMRTAMGTLPVVPLAFRDSPIDAMTQWLKNGECPAPFELGDECELRAPGDEGSVIRCKRHDLTAAEIGSHLDKGMRVEKLALRWNDAIDFVLDDQLAIKRLKYADKITDQVDDRQPESAAEAFDLDFSVMTIELSAMLKSLQSALGGPAQNTNKESESVQALAS